MSSIYMLYLNFPFRFLMICLSQAFCVLCLSWLHRMDSKHHQLYGWGFSFVSVFLPCDVKVFAPECTVWCRRTMRKDNLAVVVPGYSLLHHHHHHHQSLKRQGRWGTTDDFATSFLHFSLGFFFFFFPFFFQVCLALCGSLTGTRCSQTCGVTTL